MEVQILEYGLCLIEYTVCYIFLNTLLEKRFTSYLPLILVIITAFTLSYFFVNLNMSIKTILNLIVLISGSLFLYKDRLVVKFSYSFLLLFIFSFVLASV